jgi:hypothetical protein
VVTSVKPAYPRGTRPRSWGCGEPARRGHLARSGAPVDVAVPIDLPAYPSEGSPNPAGNHATSLDRSEGLPYDRWRHGGIGAILLDRRVERNEIRTGTRLTDGALDHYLIRGSVDGRVRLRVLARTIWFEVDHTGG